MGVRGYVSGMKPARGISPWRFYTVPGDLEAMKARSWKRAKTWSGECGQKEGEVPSGRDALTRSSIALYIGHRERTSVGAENPECS